MIVLMIVLYYHDGMDYMLMIVLYYHDRKHSCSHSPARATTITDIARERVRLTCKALQEGLLSKC